jgi:hypothetical protein
MPVAAYGTREAQRVVGRAPGAQVGVVGARESQGAVVGAAGRAREAQGVVGRAPGAQGAAVGAPGAQAGVVGTGEAQVVAISTQGAQEEADAIHEAQGAVLEAQGAAGPAPGAHGAAIGAAVDCQEFSSPSLGMEAYERLKAEAGEALERELLADFPVFNVGMGSPRSWPTAAMLKKELDLVLEKYGCSTKTQGQRIMCSRADVPASKVKLREQSKAATEPGKQRTHKSNVCGCEWHSRRPGLHPAGKRAG